MIQSREIRSSWNATAMKEIRNVQKFDREKFERRRLLGGSESRRKDKGSWRKRRKIKI
jgi:hypothetical protein